MEILELSDVADQRQGNCAGVLLRGLGLCGGRLQPATDTSPEIKLQAKIGRSVPEVKAAAGSGEDLWTRLLTDGQSQSRERVFGNGEVGIAALDG